MYISSNKTYPELWHFICLACQAVFFGGLDQNLRTEAWPFLLQYYPYNSTFEQREDTRNDKYIEYQNLRKMRCAYGKKSKAHIQHDYKY